MEEQKSLNESIINIRVELQKSKLKKSGKNKFAGFDYFELADFLPKLNELMLKENINDRFSIISNEDGTMNAVLNLIKGNETQTYTMPFIIFDTPLVYKKDKNGAFIKDKEGNYIQVPSMQDIQYLGALNTYYKRYLYLNAFGITDGEIIDSMNNDNLPNKVGTKNEPNYRTELIEYCKKENIDIKEVAKNYQLIGKKLTNDDYYDVLCDIKGEKENASSNNR